MINFYQRCVKDLASIARFLTALIRKGKGGKVCYGIWNARKFKILLVTAPILQPPDLTKEFFHKYSRV